MKVDLQMKTGSSRWIGASLFFAWVAGFSISALAAETDESGAAGKPNILWIVAEDIGLHVGCYGNKSVHTPNLDRLASEGALFTRAFTNTPVCSSSRSSFMIGMYPTSIGAHNHRTVPALKKPLPI